MHREKLVDEARGLLGMIAEIKAKTRLYMSIIQKEDNWIGEPLVTTSVIQMRNELATYSRRLDEIQEELRSYVVISDISGKSSEPRLHV